MKLVKGRTLQAVPNALQNGFATSAESAGVLRRARVWVARDRTLAALAAVLLVLLGKVMVDGQRAALAIRRLSASAPVFAARAQELLKDGEAKAKVAVG